LDNPDSLEDYVDIDDRFIDEDMFGADPAEADRLYLELKGRAIRKLKNEIRQSAIREAMAEEEEGDADDMGVNSSMTGGNSG